MESLAERPPTEAIAAQIWDVGKCWKVDVAGNEEKRMFGGGKCG